MRTVFEELLAAYNPFNKNGNVMEQAEADLLQYLRGTEDEVEQEVILTALEKYGSILAVPTLFGLAPFMEPMTVRPQLKETITAIKRGAKERGSVLPDEFFTLAHWKTKWRGSRENFLSYVTGLAAAHPDVKSGLVGHDEELTRLGNLLVQEMDVDLVPYNNFDEMRICTTGWDEEAGMHVLLDRLEQERVMEQLQGQGIEESDISFLVSQLKDLQYAYLITRLKLHSHFEFNRFALEMAECLNVPEE